ncbi:FAD-dependent monooxygenase [Nakamurella panacisegetis]|nr:FAD-dependent monooxygenase [Nakamurella panacisegetis]
MDMTETDVLIVGAGPTGLTLALQAHDHGARVRIVDRRSGPPRPSRAMIVHPRTMEVLRPLGVTDALLARGDRRPSATLHLGRRAVPAHLTDFALGDTAFPHLLLIRQSDVEAVLLAAAAQRGLAVEWDTAFESYRIDSGSPIVTVRRGWAQAQISAQFLVGADGSTSAVRHRADITSDGAAYPVDVVLADVELDGTVGAASAHVAAGRKGLVFLFPLGEQATWRLLVTVPTVPSGEPFGQIGPPVPREELDRLVDGSGIGVRIAQVAWSSRIRVQHRVAARYRVGPVLLAGDAAHTFSPAGGQGMNTGIQDATNLGWKLALLCAHDVARERLLASYEAERRAVARQTRALTHLLFWVEAGTGLIPSFLRGSMAPLAAPLIPVLLGRRHLIAAGIRVLSQLRWTYRHSPLSGDLERGRPSARGSPCGRVGDRLPDQAVVVDDGRRHLHELTATAGFHVLLQRDAQPLTLDHGLVHTHRVHSWPGRAAIVVRPDGHIGHSGSSPAVEAWLRALGVTSVARRGSAS